MNTRARILVVDDEPQIRRFLRPALEASGYEVLQAESGAEALRLMATLPPRAMILDLGLPDIDGKEVIRTLRKWSDIPVIVLTARDDEAEIIAALDAGGDDYVRKPFGIGELLARLRAALRGGETESDRKPAFVAPGRDVEIDLAAHEVRVRGEIVRLTPKEFDLLAYLAANAGRVLTHRMLLTRVWGPAHGQDSQYLRVFIGRCG